jgi:hypothetical protein
MERMKEMITWSRLETLFQVTEERLRRARVI